MTDCLGPEDRCLGVAQGCGTCLPDPDDDGVPNLAPTVCASGSASVACDNCPEVANADQADGDGDHLGDACDAAPTTANYKLHRGTVAPAGGLTVGAAHDLVGTAGQPAVGAGELRTKRYRLRSGFGGAATASQHP